MKKLKHSKFKNTGILFEMLVRQIAADTLNNRQSKSIDLIKKYFNKRTELHKELALYQTVMNEKFSTEDKANQLIEAVVTTQKQLNRQLLNKEKYNLIRDIQKNYSIEEFFKSNINNYKELASTYKLFEYQLADNPSDILRTRHTLVEYVKTPNTTKAEVQSMHEFTTQEKDIRLLSYKMLVDNFNKKYTNLNTSQKKLIREYINNVNNTVVLKSYVDSEIPKLRGILQKYVNTITDQVIKIKLKETVSLLDNIKNSKTIKDKQIVSMLRYYELVKELKKV